MSLNKSSKIWKEDILLDLPGGIALIGGNAILPGVVELAQEVFGVRVKTLRSKPSWVSVTLRLRM